jgi:hypothetical protein
MEAMGGTLTAVSVEGQGTTFTLELALSDRPPARTTSHRPSCSPAPGTRSPAPSTPSSTSRTIPPTCAWSSGSWPPGRGPAAHRREGEIVQELVRQHRPDLILLDLHLPGIDGEEVLRRLRADPRTADLPVVMVSADVTPWYRERLLEAAPPTT